MGDPASQWPPRIIFNSDGGSMSLYRYPVPITEEQCVTVVRELEGTAVDVFNMAVGDSLSNYLKDSPHFDELYTDIEQWVGLPGEAGERIIAGIRGGFEGVRMMSRTRSSVAAQEKKQEQRTEG